MPRALPLARGMSKPVASGEDACTREDGSRGPVTARSGGIADHAAERGRVGHRQPRYDRDNAASRDSGERGDVPPHARGHGDRLHAGRHAGKITGPE